MIRRRALTLLALTCAALAGCAPSKPADPRTEITLWKNQAGLQEEAATTALIDRFNASQRRWRVVAQSLPQGGYNQSIVAASLSGRMPCIVAVDSPMVASYAWAGHLRPLDNFVPAATIAAISPAAVGRYDGQTYAVGQFDAALAIFIRRSTLVLMNARVPTLDRPWSGAEFQTLLDRLKASGRYRYPLDLSTRDDKASWWTYAFGPMIASFGGDLIDRTTMRSAQGVLNGAAALRFGTWFQALFARGLVNRKEPDENAFVKGRAAVVYTGNWWAPDYRAYAGADLLILPPPDFGHGVVIGGGSWEWAIGKSCMHPAGAGAFIRFLLEPANIAAMSDASGGVPTTEAGAAASRAFRPGFPGGLECVHRGDARHHGRRAGAGRARRRGRRHRCRDRRQSGLRAEAPMSVLAVPRRRGRFTALIFGAPALAGLAMFLVIPFVMALALTFTNQRLVSPEASAFVGLRNYERLLSVTMLVQEPVRTEGGVPAFVRVRAVTRVDPAYAGYRPLTAFRLGARRVTILARDPAFLRALRNTFVFALMVVPLQCLMALGLALLVNAGLRGQTVFRAIYFSPVVMSMVIVSVIWSFLFDKDLGLFNRALELVSFGLIAPVDWLGNARTAMPAIVIMSAWQGAGFQMLILLAGLQGIAQELYDAARIDGATAWQRFRHITLPGLRQTIVFVLIVTTIAALGLFTQVDVMTGGGPRGATATVMFEAVQRGVREENIAYGATIALIYFAIITAVILLQQLLARRLARRTAA